ncbi:MAG: hypothetical protein ACREM3_29650, partial [Candidatus Rokuibacteriota bacterium]
MRYVGYVVAALLALVVLLAVGSWLAVRAWGPELARERVEAALADALGRPARVEHVVIEPWLGRVVIRGVTVGALAGEPGPHLFTLGRLDANVGISSLWRRRVVLRSVRLDDLDLRLRAGGGGAALRELPMLPEVVPAGPVEVELGRIELSRGRLSYEDPARAVRVEAEGLAATVRPGREATSATLAAREIRVDTAQLRERAEQLEAEIRIAPTRLEVRRLEGTWDRRTITVAGRVDGPFDEPAVDLTARGDVDLATLARRFGSPWPLAGLARARARVEGPAAAPRVTGSVELGELTAGPVKARAVTARLAFAGGVLSVTELSARAFDGSVSGTAVLEPAHLDRAHVALSLRGVSSA